MNRLAIIIVFAIGFIVCSCQKDKPYSIYWQDNNLCVVMPHPTFGIVELNREYWNGVELADVVNDIFYEIKANSKFNYTNVILCFESLQTDKYGNEIKSYETFKIAAIPTAEAPKYKAGKFFDSSFHITDNIRNAAFGNIENPDIINLTNDTVPSVNISTQELNQAEEDWEQWLRQRDTE